MAVVEILLQLFLKRSVRVLLHGADRATLSVIVLTSGVALVPSTIAASLVVSLVLATSASTLIGGVSALVSIPGDLFPFAASALPRLEISVSFLGSGVVVLVVEVTLRLSRHDGWVFCLQFFFLLLL